MNHGTRTFAGWTASWAWPRGQTSHRSGTARRPIGHDVTVRNVAWNGTIAPDGTTTFGFLGSWTGANTTPTLTCAGT